MDVKSKIEQLLDELKSLGKERRTIEKELKYSIFYIDQLLSKGGNVRFYNALKRYYDMLTQESHNRVAESPAPYSPSSYDFWAGIPEYRHCDFSTKAKGNSMHPVIQNNAIVGGKKLTDASVIVFGEIYIIQTKNGIETIKYIQPVSDDPQSILLLSLQDNAPGTLLRKSDILNLYEAQFVLNPL